MPPKPIRPKPGQESVWDYPRPPALEPTSESIRVVFAGTVVAATNQALRLLETSHPPTYYLPPSAFADGVLVPVPGGSFCEWKGRAVYFDLVVEARRAQQAAWAYPDPTPRYVALRDHLAVYAHLMDACYVDGEPVTPQPGNFYGGWITRDVVGPFKGGPGTWGW